MDPNSYIFYDEITFERFKLEGWNFVWGLIIKIYFIKPILARFWWNLAVFHYPLLKVGTGKIVSVRNSIVDPYTVQILLMTILASFLSPLSSSPSPFSVCVVRLGLLLPLLFLLELQQASRAFSSSHRHGRHVLHQRTANQKLRTQRIRKLFVAHVSTNLLPPAGGFIDEWWWRLR